MLLGSRNCVKIVPSNSSTSIDVSRFKSESIGGSIVRLNDIFFSINKIIFQWDEQKNKINQQKHGISFEEAESVFFDDYAVQFWDEEHSQEEERFLLLGLSSQMRILIVVHCFREEDSIIRIVSARKATKNESKEYRR